MTEIITGRRSTMKSAGMIRNKIGNRILTGAFWARSSTAAL